MPLLSDRHLFETHPSVMLIIDPSSGTIVDANAAAERFYGWTRAELEGRPLSEINTMDPERLAAAMRSAVDGREHNFHVEHRLASGERRFVESHTGPFEHHGRRLLFSVVIDETPRVLAERALARRDRLYDMLSETDQCVMRAPDPEALLHEVCRVAVSHGGFRFAWIGMVRADGAVEPVARAGDDDGYIDQVRSSVRADDPHSLGPTARAILRGESVIVEDFRTDAHTATWRAAAASANVGSSASFPLRQDERVIGALVLYAAEPHFFEATERATLEEMASDISFGLDKLASDARRVAAEAHAAKWSERLERYLEGSPTISYAIALDDNGGWRSEWVSRNAEQILGFTVAEMLADGWWAAQLHPDDRADAIRRSNEIVTTGEGRLEYRFRTGRGEQLWILDTSRYTPHPSGAGGQISGTWTDITEQRKAEIAQRLQIAALEAAADAIVITDRDAAIEWANPAFTALTGYALDEAIGRNPSEIVRSGAQGREFYAAMWETLLAGRVWRGELINRRKDGSEYPEWLTITPVRDGAGEIRHFVAIKRDVTEDRTLRANLQQAQKMESVGQLAGGVAHDFNNLLTVIGGSIEFALSHVGPHEEIHADLLEIQRASERAGALTRQLLAFSRRQILRRQVVDLNHLVGDLTKMLGRLIGEDVSLRTELGEPLGAVLADPGQIGQVLMNLVVNARDAMPTGGTLTITTADVDLTAADIASGSEVQPGPFVRLGVRDTGTGMDAATRLRLFEPFFTTKEPGKGTGLGLSTAFGIVSQSGGLIRVFSEPGEGSRFEIDLPRASATGEVVVPAIVAPAAPPTRATILVVDDEEVLRSISVRILTRAGYTAISAASAEEALRLVDEGARVDLVLTDVVMPGMNGPELAATLQRRRPGLKVLFTSGFTDDMVLRHGVDEATMEFLPKPFKLAELTRRVAELLAG